MQKDSMLKVPASNDKSQAKFKIFESKIGAIFGRKCDIQCNVLKNLIYFNYLLQTALQAHKVHR